LSDIISRIKGFLSGAGVGVGIRTAIRVFKTAKIVGVIVGAVEIKASKGVGVEAFFCTRYNKIVL
jgi:hypothetical protein